MTPGAPAPSPAPVCSRSALSEGAGVMPKRHGLRDDDTLGRLADLERRLDALEREAEATPAKKDAKK